MNMTRESECSERKIKGCPKVSVITVVRNDKEGLEKTIASISKQDYPNLEYIVIDGASTDGTVEMIKENEQFINIWVSESDNGLYDAMNKGKTKASGDYVHFLNAGDWFSEIDSLRKMLSPTPVGGVLIFGNVLLSHGSRIWRVPRQTRRRPQLSKSYVPHHQTVLYPKVFYSLQDYDLSFSVSADADYTTRAVRQLTSEYRNVDLVSNVLGGFTFTMYRSLKGAIKMNCERQTLYRKYAQKYSRFYAARLAVQIFGKYLAVRLGGIKLATLLMQMKMNFG